MSKTQVQLRQMILYSREAHANCFSSLTGLRSTYVMQSRIDCKPQDEVHASGFHIVTPSLRWPRRGDHSQIRMWCARKIGKEIFSKAVKLWRLKTVFEYCGLRDNRTENQVQWRTSSLVHNPQSSAPPTPNHQPYCKEGGCEKWLRHASCMKE